ncbi:ubiquitin ligase [Fusarium beomiforme]|uniref:Ubiquitin ligase n=1 Tax=Fusarium beomiforme TaxID=44412 RepID=A0A9P5ABF7_9HYPO|nr:ubiquitin ligase [Fusarium beomiforme]
MASSSFALSQTLGVITQTKISELGKQRTIYEARKDKILEEASQENDQVARIKLLLEGVQNLNAEAFQSPAVKNIKHWLSQSKYDVSVPSEFMQAHEELLRSHLEVPSRKLALGHLYARLITEWMTASHSGRPASEEESFEIVDRQKERLQQLCDKFERVVFEPLETDEVEIDLYLNELFQGEQGEESAKPLKTLRETIGNSCRQIFGEKSPFDSTTLKWCINGLLAEDLLSDQKQAILRDFLEKPVVLGEIADVLNMRFSNIDSWEWDAGEQGIPVLPRQQLNGKYRIWMDEDVLQAILIHYIGIQCCVALKKALNSFISSGDTIWRWHTGPHPSREEKQRRMYYLSSGATTSSNIDNERKRQYASEFFMSQLPENVETIGSGGYTDSTEEQDTSKKPNIKQRLLRTLATEATIHRTLKGEVALVQTDLEWFATGLSHTTIFATMRFFGYTEEAISFFKKVLQAPLNVQSSPDSPLAGSPRVRRRGVPMAHAPEKLLGELVLFVMDVVVNQQDGMLLYRLHDDLWLCGEPLHCKRAWVAMNQYAEVLGLTFNKSKTGSVYITEDAKKRDIDAASTLPEGPVRVGHLYLDPKSGIWEIDREQVEVHMRQLKKQLDQCTSVLEWVQTWNSCMGRFFSHTFGEPAHCFGLHHVDSILETYQMMQEFLFPVASDSSRSSHGAVSHVKRMIKDRFGADVPDAFIHLPERLGGLGLRNPFLPILMIRESIAEKSPSSIIQQFFDAENERYKRYKKYFDSLASVDGRINAAVKAAGTAETVISKTLKKLLSSEELENFFSIEEYTKHRELTSSALSQAYLALQTVPVDISPEMDSDVSQTLTYELGVSPSGSGSKLKEARWVLQMYRDALRRDYGGLRLVDKEHLPLGVLTLLRSRAVTWTMVL